MLRLPSFTIVALDPIADWENVHVARRSTSYGEMDRAQDNTL